MILFTLPEEGGVGVETTLWLCSMREIASFRDIRALEQMSELLKSFSHLIPILCPTPPFSPVPPPLTPMFTPSRFHLNAEGF